MHAITKGMKITCGEVLNAEIGGILSDHLLRDPLARDKDVLRAKFAAGAFMKSLLSKQADPAIKNCPWPRRRVPGKGRRPHCVGGGAFEASSEGRSLGRTRLGTEG